MANGHPIRTLLGAVAFAGISCTSQVWADGMHEMQMDGHDMAMQSGSAPAMAQTEADTRLVVDFPPAFKSQELANMRNHLETLQQITHYLAAGNFQAAADIANQHLTRGSMSEDNRHQAMHYMPKEMVDMGAAMHRAAGQFAIVAQDAAVSGDMASALGALAEVQNRCVACHSTYRMK